MAARSRSSSSTENGVLEVGRIARPHGLRGELVVHLTTTEVSRLAPGAMLFADQRRLVVRTARRQQQRWVVAFEEVDTREAADELRGSTLFAEPLADDTDAEALWVHELIGAQVVDADGVDRGRIEAVQENPASDVLVLESGVLVPLTFAVGWDVRGERLRIDAPDGLFDL
jgi:16S rRNA processing protein RimM